MAENAVLKKRMRALGLSQDELARQMNEALRRITGRPGKLSDRSVRNLVKGKTRRPIGRTCVALEEVFGCPVEELGLIAPSIKSPTEEDPLLRRSFLVAFGTAAVPAPASRRTVGASDVERLRVALDQLNDVDQATGGTSSVERAALKQAQVAIDLARHGSAATRVRNKLYCLAADATTAAAWAALDGRRHDDGRRYLEQAMPLAIMSGDGAAQFDVWNLLSMLAKLQDNEAESLAAAQAMRNTLAVRRDPLFASLAHARVALAQGLVGEHHSALRTLERAHTAIDRAQDVSRPAWMAFYDLAELNGISAVCMLAVGRHEEAEYHAHQSLARIRPSFVRNRAVYTVRMATAQLRQGDVERAIATIGEAEIVAETAHGSARLRTLIGDFQRELISRAPDAAVTRDYIDRMRNR
ncbi:MULTISPECIES: helix-turn-helix domain-containing protein [Streptomycetaceae]|nr:MULTISPECIES: helix-turn-helix transcriptional regulator [Streptomycetaceae]MYS58754.1 XRE family transcriptional regulator [Streptomyces sp. SID5468]